MPDSPWNDLVPMAMAFAIVAGGVVPPAIAAWLICRGREPLFPPVRKPTPWSLFDVFGLCLIYLVVLPLGAAGVPFFILIYLFWYRLVAAARLSVSLRRCLADVALGVVAFLLLTPLTLVVNALANAIVIADGGTPDSHKLTKTNLESFGGIADLFASACVAAPIFEELIFRGVLLPWACARRVFPWLVLTSAAALLLSRGPLQSGALAVALMLIAGMFALIGLGRYRRRFPIRALAAIYSSSALFAALHVLVWPSPVPLFVLGVGLGILTVRSGSVRPAILAHALFNAVSAVYLLRSPGP